MSFHAYSFSRLVVVTGLALWLSIAVFNNLSDPGTNRLHIGNTLSMALLEEEEILGAALLWRAWPAHWAENVLYVVAGIQIAVSLLLWFAAFSYAQAWRRGSRSALHTARNRAVIALTCFLLLWFSFVCGGLWFGYWMKQGAIQSVHMTLILIGIGALLFVQGEPAPNQSIQVIDPISPGKSRQERSHP
jgi:predicted small integral membrane protein